MIRTYFENIITFLQELIDTLLVSEVEEHFDSCDEVMKERDCLQYLLDNYTEKELIRIAILFRAYEKKL